MGSMPKDTYAIPRYHMIHAHQTFKVGYDSILSRLDDPPMQDLGNFMGYCQAWACAVADHHDTEETIVFPFLTQKLDFSGEIEEHKGIHDTLDILLKLIHEAQADPSKFDAAEFKLIMTGLREPLYHHLDTEIEHIAPDRLRVFDEADMKDMLDRMDAYAKSHGDPFLVVPFMRSHTPPEYKDSWPPMPWVLRKVVIPYALALRHSGYWKYAPYAMS